jgi:hypothetical protein
MNIRLGHLQNVHRFGPSYTEDPEEILRDYRIVADMHIPPRYMLSDRIVFPVCLVQFFLGHFYNRLIERAARISREGGSGSARRMPPVNQSITFVVISGWQGLSPHTVAQSCGLRAALRANWGLGWRDGVGHLQRVVQLILHGI